MNLREGCDNKAEADAVNTFTLEEPVVALSDHRLAANQSTIRKVAEAHSGDGHWRVERADPARTMESAHVSLTASVVEAGAEPVDQSSLSTIGARSSARFRATNWTTFCPPR